MGIAYNTSIVRDGLVLHLDAANSKSYSGSGLNIKNLAQSSSNGVLSSSVTFSDENEGILNFNGSNGEINLSSGFSITNNFSVEFWCLPESSHEIDSQSTSSTSGTGGQKYIIGATHMNSNGGFGVSIGNNGVSVYEHGAAYMPPLLVHASDITTFTQIVIVYIDKTPKLYINGNFIKNGLTSQKSFVFLVGSQIGYGSYGRYQGKLSSMKYYNRTLNDSEIKQNFEALRGRYGI
jgi:O-antigen biosynthesis protein